MNVRKEKKNYKFIDRYLSKDDWETLLSTYVENSYENMWKSMFTCHHLFRKYSKMVSAIFGYPYPDYDSAITKYIDRIFHSYR